MSTLEGVFRNADIEEVFQDNDGTVFMAFTIRDTNTRISVSAADLEGVLKQAEEIFRRDHTMERLRDEGLTDADIDRLSAMDLIDDAWQRGWMAKSQEADYEAELRAHELWVASQQPAMAAAAEPDRPLTVDIFAADGEIEQMVDPGKVGIPIILQVPARIVLS